MPEKTEKLKKGKSFHRDTKGQGMLVWDWGRWGRFKGNLDKRKDHCKESLKGRKFKSHERINGKEGVISCSTGASTWRHKGRPILKRQCCQKLRPSAALY